MAAEWWALGVSILALVITLARDFIKPFLFKPRISLLGIDDGECVQKASDKLYNIESIWLRLKLINKYSFWSIPAKNCYVKLLSVKNSSGEKIIPLESLPLPWVSYDGDFIGSRHDLSVGEYHMIDLVYEYPHRRVLEFKIHVPVDLMKEAEKKLGVGIYTIKVAVYGDNFKPLFKHIKVKLTDKFGELNFA